MSKPLKQKKTPATDSARWLNQKTIPFLLVGLVLLVYGQTLSFNFSWFDDEAILLRNQDYISDVSNLIPSATRDAEFHEKTIELYRPLQNMSFIVDAWVGGFSAGSFHFSNMMLHLFTVLMLFLLLIRLKFSMLISFVGAAMLAVHPVFAFAVAWLPARGDLLLAFWSITSIYFFIRFLDGRKAKWLLLHLIAFFFAMLSKETAVVLIPLLICYYLLFQKDRRWELWQGISGGVYSGILILYFLMRNNAIAEVRGGTFGIMPLLQNLPVMPETLLKFLIPYPIVALPFYTLVPTVAGILLGGLLIFLAWKSTGNNRIFLFGAAWFLGFTAPSMFYRPDWSDYIYDYLIHRSYLPLTGIIVIISGLLVRLEPHMIRRPWVLIPSGVFVLFVALSFSLAGQFRDPLSFWSYAVKTNPQSPFAHTYLGGAWFFSENPGKAIESYNRALALKPDFSEALLNRGITLASAGNHANAITDFNNYLLKLPDDTMVLRYRAASLMEQSAFDTALMDLKQLMDQGDRSAKTLYQYSICLLMTGNYVESGNTLGQLLETSPNTTSYLKIAALTDLMTGNPDQAIAKHQQVLALEGSTANSLANLGFAYWEKGLYEMALETFQKSYAIDSASLSVRLGLMITWHALGRKDKVMQFKQQSIEVLPDLARGESAIVSLERQGYLFTPKQRATLLTL
jgi:protein O-mannosyl-transferase